MIVTISGQAGSGKSTVAKLLARALHYRHYSIGDMRRRMATERGLTLAQLNALGEAEAFTDQDVDEFQRKLGEEEDELVIDGRTSWYFIPHSTKVYLDARLGERAKRVFSEERESERFLFVTECKIETPNGEEHANTSRVRHVQFHKRSVHVLPRCADCYRIRGRSIELRQPFVNQPNRIGSSSDVIHR